MPSGNPYAHHEADNYFHDQAHDQKMAAGAGRARGAESILGRRGRLLEIGCGRGEGLLGARAEGWEVEGIDATPWDGSAELLIEHATAEESRRLDAENHYDVVVMAAVLEHLYDPVRVLARVHHALKPNGLLYIEVPNECSLWTRVGNAYFRARGRAWASNLSPSFPPYHVVGFCPRSLRATLAATGFAIHRLTTATWHSDLPKTAPLPERLGEALVLRLGGLIGMGIGMHCWARKMV